jgi:hypothetical protein
MPTREELHQLIDSLPESAMDAALRMLSSLQTWPPAPLPDLEAMRKRHDDQRDEIKKRMAERPRRGGLSAYGGGGGYTPAMRSGSSSMSHWEGDALVVQTYRMHLGNELLITERFYLDGRHLVYEHAASGPGNKRDEREIVFEIV